MLTDEEMYKGIGKVVRVYLPDGIIMTGVLRIADWSNDRIVYELTNGVSKSALFESKSVKTMIIYEAKETIISRDDSDGN